jgi:ATPase subunit of ABC transporter with duplicated ATPase domains
MLVARDVEVRAGARLLLEHASFQVAPGNKIGLVGRNGAGKTTLTKILSGEAPPASGRINRTGTIGYLPQDPRTGDLDVLPRTASCLRAVWTRSLIGYAVPNWRWGRLGRGARQGHGCIRARRG